MARAEHDVGVAALAVALERVARDARAEQQQVVEVRQPPLRAEAADVVDALARRALDLGDRRAVEEVRLAQAAGVPRSPISTPGVVDLEVVELPRRAVAAELGRVDVVDARRASSSSRSSATVLVAQLLLDAVGAEARDRAADVEVRLVDRVAERVAGVAADDEAAALRHERAQVADRAADDDVDALHRDAAARARVAVDDEQAAVAGRAGRLARVAVDDDRPDIMFSARPVPALPCTRTVASLFIPAQ